MDTTQLLLVLAAIIVVFVIGAWRFPDYFRGAFKFLGLQGEVEGGRSSGGDPGGPAHVEPQSVPTPEWEATAEDSAGAQVAAGIGIDQSMGDTLPEPADVAAPHADQAPSLKATAKNAPGAQVAAGTDIRQHRDDPAPADGEAPGKGE